MQGAEFANHIYNDASAQELIRKAMKSNGIALEESLEALEKTIICRAN